MIRALFLLPVRDNDGRSLTSEISEVEDRCFVEFGAWTAGGYFKGAWRMKTGERALDTTAVYILYLERDRLEALRVLLREFKAKTRHEAILLEVSEAVDVELI